MQYPEPCLTLNNLSYISGIANWSNVYQRGCYLDNIKLIYANLIYCVLIAFSQIMLIDYDRVKWVKWTDIFVNFAQNAHFIISGMAICFFTHNLHNMFLLTQIYISLHTPFSFFIIQYCFANQQSMLLFGFFIDWRLL